jgi:hypothetical protein
VPRLLGGPHALLLARPGVQPRAVQQVREEGQAMPALWRSHSLISSCQQPAVPVLHWHRRRCYFCDMCSGAGPKELRAESLRLCLAYAVRTRVQVV